MIGGHFNHANNNGATALMYASQEGHTEIAKLIGNHLAGKKAKEEIKCSNIESLGYDIKEAKLDDEKQNKRSEDKYLSGQKVSDSDMKEIAAYICTQNHTLRKLELDDNLITDQGIKILFEIINSKIGIDNLELKN